MNLETIQGMWEKDSQIDPDELHTASLVVPTLHAKYYQLYNDLRLLRTKSKKVYQKVLQERYLYYSGKAEPEVYEKDPFPYKVREKDAIQRYLDSDQRLSDAELKVEYYNTMLDYLENIIKTIQNRTFQIKNAIEWQKFIRGYD
tara:strand:- start:831 stop:1262 length:432 start_codon:yes stop_codon:yes gene_type:complete